MADRRRRRLDQVTSESEYSESDEQKPTPKPIVDGAKRSECESEDEDLKGEGSEYESATEENEEDDYTYTEDYSEDESSVLVEEEYTESEIFEEERQSGDGEEDLPSNEELDDDEDRKNPAFVPRKGMFYEHDDRQGEEEEEAADETEVPPVDEKENIRKKKQLWQESHRWDHDRFDENLQAPKSREELITAYGYDIQLHDKPPEAPPQRGRGGRYRGNPSENRANFGDYMAGRFENPRTPRYGPKAETRGRGRGGRGYRGVRGSRVSRGGRGDYRNTTEDQEHGQGDRQSYSDFKSTNSYRNNFNDENRTSDNRYSNNRNISRNDGDGDGPNRNENKPNKDRDHNTRGWDYRNQDEDCNSVSSPSTAETRTFTNSRVQGNQPRDYGNDADHPERGQYSKSYMERQYSHQSQGNQQSRGYGNNVRSERDEHSSHSDRQYSQGKQQQRDYGSNSDRPSPRGRQHSNYSDRQYSQQQNQGGQQRQYGNNQDRSDRGRSSDNRQYNSQRESGYGHRDGNSRHNDSGPPSSGYSRNERREQYNRKSRSPDGKRPGNTRAAEASLDNLMDIAPPLTTVETRTKGNVLTSAADTDGRRGGYTQDRRQKGGRRSQDDGKSDGPIKGREIQERPPRFREQGKDQTRSSYHGQAAESQYQSKQQQQQATPSTSVSTHKPHPSKTTPVTHLAEASATANLPIKPDVSRQTKRYSSQRQRNVADTENNPTPLGLAMVTQKGPVMGISAGVSAVSAPAAQVGVLASGQVVPLVSGVGGQKTETVVRLVSPPAVVGTSTSPVRPHVKPQFYIQQQPPQLPQNQQQQVFRRPPPVYRSVQAGPSGAPVVVVTAAQSPLISVSQQAQLQQQLIQQQAIAMQASVPSTQMQAVAAHGRIFATAQQGGVRTAAPHPTAITMVTGASAAPQGQAQRAQFIPVAPPLVNIAAAGSGTRPPGHFPISGQVPGQFPGPPPPLRAEVPTSTANVGNVVQGQLVTLTTVPQGQLPPRVPLQAGQLPSLPQNQAAAQVVGTPGQPPAIHVRGGTTYFHPQIQVFSDGRSPARRQKEPIPIVKPQLPVGATMDLEEGQFYQTSEGLIYQQYAVAYATQAQLYSSPIAGQQEEAKAASSFENILKQSGSLDNIKEFHPQGVSDSPGVVAAESELIGDGAEDTEHKNIINDGISTNEGGHVDEGDVDNSEFTKVINEDLQELHISGSSIEHERFEDQDLVDHGNQSYSTDGNQSYSSMIAEIEDGNLAFEESVHNEGVGQDSSSLMQSEDNAKVVQSGGTMSESLDNSGDEQTYTTEESDSEHFYEADNDIASEENDHVEVDAIENVAVSEDYGHKEELGNDTENVQEVLEFSAEGEMNEQPHVDSTASHTQDVGTIDVPNVLVESNSVSELAADSTTEDTVEDTDNMVGDGQNAAESEAPSTEEKPSVQAEVKGNSDINEFQEVKQSEGQNNELVSAKVDVS